MPRTKKLTESAEDCLEAIYVLSKTKKVVRVKDIAKHLDTKMASIVVGLKTLAEKGLVEHEHYGYVELTPAGEEIAKKVHYRHQLLFEFFHETLGLPEKVADRDACRLEHYLSAEGLERIIKFIEFVKSCPEGAPTWLTNFYYFLQYGHYPKTCIQKLEKSIVSLDQLSSVQGEVIKLGGKASFKQALLKKGFVPGAVVKIEERTVEGLKAKIGKKQHFLTSEEAKQIFVKEI